MALPNIRAEIIGLLGNPLSVTYNNKTYSVAVCEWENRHGYTLPCIAIKEDIPHSMPADISSNKREYVALIDLHVFLSLYDNVDNTALMDAICNAVDDVLKANVINGDNYVALTFKGMENIEEAPAEKRAWLHRVIRYEAYELD